MEKDSVKMHNTLISTNAEPQICPICATGPVHHVLKYAKRPTTLNRCEACGSFFVAAAGTLSIDRIEAPHGI